MRIAISGEGIVSAIGIGKDITEQCFGHDDEAMLEALRHHDGGSQTQQMAAELAGDMLRSKGTLSSAGLGCSLSDRTAYQAAPATPAYQAAPATPASPTPSIAAVKNVKFLSVLSPIDTPEAIFRLKVKSQEDEHTSLQVTVEAGNHPIAKLSFTLWTQQK